MAQSTVCKVMAKSDEADTYGHLTGTRQSPAGHR
jgi:hypothetical protein